ncbi:MAG: hypothetical protein HKN47_29150, partial [Pirellulaceae bacterium]|nr:hypothetical protein [Pirellulaceae bacterium]
MLPAVITTGQETPNATKHSQVAGEPQSQPRSNRPTAPPGQAVPDRAAVLEVLEKFSSRSFRVRQDAEDALWAMGPSIQGILIESLESGDLEFRQRIKSIQRKFALGITPDMPANIRQWITVAINSSSEKQRREATANLTRERQFAAVLGVLDQVKTARQRSDYFSIIMTASRSLDPTDELDDFQFALLRLAVNEPNPQDSMRLTRHVLRDSNVRKRASNKAWIERLIDLMPECPTDIARRNLIDSIYFDSTAIGKILETDLLAKWIDAVASEADRDVRHRHVSKLLSVSALIQSYSSSSATAPRVDLTKLYQRLGPAGKNALIDSASHVPQSLQVLHRKIGDESMLKVASLSEDASTRGNLIGRIAALDGWPQSDDPSHGVLRLIQQQ